MVVTRESIAQLLEQVQAVLETPRSPVPEPLLENLRELLARLYMGEEIEDDPEFDNRPVVPGDVKLVRGKPS